MSSDTWETVAGEVEDELKVNRSTFLAIAFPVADEETFQARLLQIQKQYFDATHHCWAFRLFEEGSVLQRSADAGEPSGTAGRPILGAIESAGLHDVGCVVVRYYGGVKLGTGGLSRAYRDSAHAALAKGKRIRRFLYADVVVEVPFARLNDAYRLVAPPDALLASESFGDQNHFTFRVRRSLLDTFTRRLQSERFTFRQS